MSIRVSVRCSLCNQAQGISFGKESESYKHVLKEMRLMGWKFGLKTIPSSEVDAFCPSCVR